MRGMTARASGFHTVDAVSFPRRILNQAAVSCRTPSRRLRRWPLSASATQASYQSTALATLPSWGASGGLGGYGSRF